MSAGKVDVLAVMERDEAHAASFREDFATAKERKQWARESQDARAAVAELIEAATFARTTANGPIGYTPGADRRLAAALARIQP